MHAMGDAGRSTNLIGQNLPCEQCGYNLRGLTTPGRCPECGTDLDSSIRAYQLRELPPDPAWAANIRAGVGLSLASLVLMLVPFLLPPEWNRMPFRNAPLSLTPGRIAALSIECIAWTLAWAAAWRLGTREPVPNGPPRPRKVAVSLRCLSTVYLLLPFAWAWATWKTQYPSESRLMPMLVLGCVGLFSAFSLLWRVGQLLRRRKLWVFAVLAWLLAVAVPLSIALIYTTFRFYRDSDPSSLGLMLRAPSYPFGAPEVLINLMWAFARGRIAGFWIWVFAAPPAFSLLVLVRTWFAYRPSAIAPDENSSKSPAAPGGKTAASSPP